MKTKFLATLLILTTINFFAKEAPTQQPITTEWLEVNEFKKILMHLKNVKIEILNSLRDVPNNYDDIFFNNLLNEFHDKSQLLQQYTSETMYDNFSLICYSMLNWNDLFDISFHNLSSMKQRKLMGLTIITDADKKELYILFESIYTKLHQNYCKENPDGELAHKTAHDMFEKTYETIISLYGFVMPKALIVKEIDSIITEFEALIAELTAQLKSS